MCVLYSISNINFKHNFLNRDILLPTVYLLNLCKYNKVGLTVPIILLSSLAWKTTFNVVYDCSNTSDAKWLTARMYNAIQWIMHKLCIICINLCRMCKHTSCGLLGMYRLKFTRASFWYFAWLRCRKFIIIIKVFSR